MARCFQTRGICKDRVYTIKIAARTIGVTEARFRQWPKDGLRLIKDQRPYLVRGADLIDFLRKREKASKVPGDKGQIYCMTCKASRHPSEWSVSYQATTALTVRVSGLCVVCGGKLGQFCKAADVADFVAGPIDPSNAVSHA